MCVCCDSTENQAQTPRAGHGGIPSFPSAVTRMPRFSKAVADPTEVGAKMTALLAPTDFALILKLPAQSQQSTCYLEGMSTCSLHSLYKPLAT